jgi:hypothetical protein
MPTTMQHKDAHQSGLSLFARMRAVSQAVVTADVLCHKATSASAQRMNHMQHTGNQTASLVWLRRDLRLHDHQPLSEAAAGGVQHVIPVYCLDPRCFLPRYPSCAIPKLGPFRCRYVIARSPRPHALGLVDARHADACDSTCTWHHTTPTMSIKETGKRLPSQLDAPLHSHSSTATTG